MPWQTKYKLLHQSDKSKTCHRSVLAVVINCNLRSNKVHFDWNSIYDNKTPPPWIKHKSSHNFQFALIEQASNQLKLHIECFIITHLSTKLGPFLINFYNGIASRKTKIAFFNVNWKRTWTMFNYVDRANIDASGRQMRHFQKDRF